MELVLTCQPNSKEYSLRPLCNGHHFCHVFTKNIVLAIVVVKMFVAKRLDSGAHFGQTNSKLCPNVLLSN